MADRGLDALIFPPNTGDWDNFQPSLRYATSVGGGGVAAAEVFPLASDPVVAIREGRRVDWWRAAQNWVSEITSPPDMSWSRFFINALLEKRLSAGKIGVAGLADVLREPEGTIAYGTMQALKTALPNATFENAEPLVHAVRKRKSSEEIDMMMKAQASAETVIAALRAHARPGITEGALYAELYRDYLRTGGEMPTMFLFAADQRMWQTHLLPRASRPLAPEDVLVIEADTKHLGYTAQAVDTVSLRPFTPLERKLIDISCDCFQLILEAMRPGRSYAELITMWESFASQNGARAGRTMGHGLGLGQDGPVTRVGGKANDLLVESGDCFVLKPWISDRDDQISARVGGLVVVEEHCARKTRQKDMAPLVVS
jgi:Xaa-Pro aminopeptidase